MKSFSALSAAGRGVACPPAFLPSRGRRPAREIATRELRSEWSISKPARALRSLRRPPHRRHLVCWYADGCVALKPGQAPSPPTGTESGSSLEVLSQSFRHFAP